MTDLSIFRRGAMVVAVLASCGSPHRRGAIDVADRTLAESFEPFIERMLAPGGELHDAVAPHEGQRVDWILCSMGYEESDPPEMGRFGWRERLRLFAGELPPRTDLSGVLESHWPVIVAVVPGRGEGYEGWSWGDRLRIRGVIRGVGEHDTLFIDEYQIARAQEARPDAVAAAPGGTVPGLDRSTPDAALRSLYQALRDQDYASVAIIMGVGAERRAELEAELREESSEILTCLEHATVVETAPVAENPHQQRIRLEGCPSKQGFTGRVEQLDDGTWIILSL